MARDYLDPLKRSGIDTLVLGCTHFPLLAPAIQQVMGPSVRLISSAEETAREVAETLAKRDHAAAPGASRTERFATTGDAAEFERLGARVLGRSVGAVEHVPVAELEGLLDDDLRAALASYEAEASCD
jgi:glutamate racemase